MNDDELRTALRGADPAADLPPAERAWVTDQLEDAVMSTRPTPPAEAWDVDGRARARRRRRPVLVGMAVAVGVAAAAAVVVVVPVVLSRAPAPATTTLTAEPFDPATASCPGVATSLTQVDTAFAGRVTSVDGTRVELDVERVYRGDPGDRVVVDASQQDGTSAALVGGFGFDVGGQYLVSAGAGRVAVCGASGPADPALQAEYERAFG